MPLVHAESLALQERALQLFDAVIHDAPDWQREILAMGVEQTRKYRDVIARFGRFPHRNAILGRPNTPEEEQFLVGWAAMKRPRGVDDLPS
jgi:uncharacterized protein (DUF924 family)